MRLEINPKLYNRIEMLSNGDGTFLLKLDSNWVDADTDEVTKGTVVYHNAEVGNILCSVFKANEEKEIFTFITEE